MRQSVLAYQASEKNRDERVNKLTNDPEITFLGSLILSLKEGKIFRRTRWELGLEKTRRGYQYDFKQFD